MIYSNENEQTASTHKVMDESHKHNVECKKLDTKEYIMYISTCRNFEKNRLTYSV